MRNPVTYGKRKYARAKVAIRYGVEIHIDSISGNGGGFKSSKVGGSYRFSFSKGTEDAYDRRSNNRRFLAFARKKLKSDSIKDGDDRIDDEDSDDALPKNRSGGVVVVVVDDDDDTNPSSTVSLSSFRLAASINDTLRTPSPLP